MRIRLVTPAPAGSRTGNRVTALRWARMLRGLGHAVSIQDSYGGEGADVLVALHAHKNAQAARRYREAFPEGRLIVAMTGTDLYRDLPASPLAREALVLADRVITLQPHGIRYLDRAIQPKARAILQSARSVHCKKVTRFFDVAVAAHLRAVKDPLLTEQASRRLPTTSRVRVLHAGAALEPPWGAMAQRASEENPRYRWFGEMAAWRTRRLIARARLLVVSSTMEGGANVISEALVSGTAVLSTRISGALGQLGARYPGFFPVGDRDALVALLRRCEEDAAFYRRLLDCCQQLAPAYAPEHEVEAWQTLLRELR